MSSFRPPVRLASIGLSAVLLLVAGGCENAPAPSAPNDPDGGDQTTSSARERALRSSCDRTLLAILDGLTYDRIGADVDPETKAADLNSWRRKCVEKAEGLADDGQDRVRVLPPEVLEATRDDKFTVRDVQHIRAALFSAAVVRRLDATDDLGRAVEAMRLLSRHLAYFDPSNGPLGVSVPQLWLMGLATPTERTLAYIELLRQMRLDAAILQMPAGGGFPDYQLVAVPIGGEVYLFDAGLGIPLPSPEDDAAMPSKPLTLAEGRENDESLRALDTVIGKYPVSALRLKTARVMVSMSPSLLADRMAILQQNLPVDVDVVLYQGLGEDAFAEKGLVRRVSEAVGVSAESLRPWGYPVALSMGQIQRTDGVKQLLDFRDQVLRGPWSVRYVVDENGQQQPLVFSSSAGDDATLRIIEEESERQRRLIEEARSEAERDAERQRRVDAGEEIAAEEFITQSEDDAGGRRALVQTLGQGRAYLLAGETQEAFRTLMRSRIAELKDPRNEMGRADAAYWVGIAQLSNGEVKTAERELSRFVEGESQSLWPAAARRAYAELLAADGRYEDAVKLVEVPLAEPSLMVLAKRWRTLGGLPSQEEVIDAAKAAEAKAADGGGKSDTAATGPESASQAPMSEKKAPTKNGSEKEPKETPQEKPEEMSKDDAKSPTAAGETAPPAATSPSVREKAPAAAPTRSGGDAE